MIVNMENKSGVTLATQGQYCTENIEVVPTFEMGGSTEKKFQDFVEGYLTEVTAKDLGSIRRIGNYAFYYRETLTSVELPESLTSIGNYAFYHCKGLTTFNIRYGITSIGASAFQGCDGFTSIYIPSSVVSVGASAFYQCKGLKSIVFDENTPIKKIEGNLVGGCSELLTFDIPKSVTEIGSSVFASCYKLTNLVIPEGVKTIGNYAFQIGPTNAKAGTLRFLSKTPPSIQSASINLNYIGTVIIPDGSRDSYLSGTNWAKFESIIYEESEVTE